MRFCFFLTKLQTVESIICPLNQKNINNRLTGYVNWLLFKSGCTLTTKWIYKKTNGQTLKIKKKTIGWMLKTKNIGTEYWSKLVFLFSTTTLYHNPLSQPSTTALYHIPLPQPSTTALYHNPPDKRMLLNLRNTPTFLKRPSKTVDIIYTYVKLFQLNIDEIKERTGKSQYFRVLFLEE